MTTLNTTTKSSVNTISGKQPEVYLTLVVNCRLHKMELTTGSDNSVVGSSMIKMLGSPRLHGWPTLTAYDGYSLSVLGAISVLLTFIGVQQQPSWSSSVLINQNFSNVAAWLHF